ncbi:uncharacterized protein [Miscanthus floridulus]|uniref:uncharacterized protein n=1 Tax=Miscanthus floridulus TaxID=154761 RepID=UPI003459FB36
MEQRMLRPAAPSTSCARPLVGRPHPAEPDRGAAAGPTLRPARGVVEAAQPLRLASSVAEAASRVCASPAPELAAFSPAKKSVSLAAACQRRGPRHGVRAEVNESGSGLAVDALSQVKHVLLPVLDRNPYLSEGTRQRICMRYIKWRG